MAKPPPIDPLRAKLVDLLEDMSNRLSRLRDHATVPGNAWLAKGELRQVTQQASDLEMLLEEIQEADQENGY
ncbi:hypothetical protein HJC99_01655 [Candidatus Saccharibacteria bacterium]|nr:hypothetical protein [Candidatus Saccharibacteria bacterium]